MSIDFKPTASLRKIRQRKKDAIDQAFKEWENRNLPSFSQPDDEYPQIPHNLSDLHNREVERLMVVFRRWDNFISERMVEAKVFYDITQDELKSTEAKLIDELRTHVGESLEKRRIAVKANEDYMKTEERTRKAKHIFDMFEMRHKQLMRDLAVMSRIVELRKLDQDGRGAREEVHNDVVEGDRYASNV